MADAMIVNGIMQGLSQLLPAVGGGVGAAMVSGMGTDAYNAMKGQANHLLNVVRHRFSQEHDGGSAASALQSYMGGDRDFEGVVRVKLERVLDEDPAFAAQALAVLRSGPLQSLMVGEEAKARNIDMSNSAGEGTQIIQTGKKSEVERVRMNMPSSE